MTDLTPADVTAWDALEKATLASKAVAVVPLSSQIRQLVDPSQSTLGPGEPPTPAHPEETEPRRWDFQPGYNLNPQPRAYEAVSFELLRHLAGSYDVARLAIEKRKDEMRGLRWHVQPRPKVGETRAEAKGRAKELEAPINDVTGFLLTPNGEDAFGLWLTQYLEDLFVIDAATLFLRKTRGGGLFAAEVVDGSTIRPIIDEHGRRPAPPLPAYGQVIRGVTWQLFTSDEISYAPYWQRSRSPYGYPPLEWVLLAVNRALRRQTLDLTQNTEGTLPIAFYRVPEAWTTGQIQELQKVMDEILAGNDLARSRVRFVPGGPNSGLDRIYEDPKSEVEEWLAVLTCAAFGTQPTDLGLPPLRAGLGGSGFLEAQQDVANRRAKKPLAMHIKGILDAIIARDLGEPELEFAWEGIEDEKDVLAIAKADEIYLRSGKVSVDELRERDDEEAIGLGAYIATASGPVLVEDLLAGDGSSRNEPTDPTDPEPGGGGGGEAPDTPSADPDELTAEGGDAMAKASADLTRWQRKAVKAVRAGRDATRFESSAIAPWQAHFLRRALSSAADPADVRAAFALAKAGASADPFGPETSTTPSVSSGASSPPSSPTRPTASSRSSG